MSSRLSIAAFLMAAILFCFPIQVFAEDLDLTESISDTQTPDIIIDDESDSPAIESQFPEESLTGDMVSEDENPSDITNDELPAAMDEAAGNDNSVAEDAITYETSDPEDPVLPVDPSDPVVIGPDDRIQVTNTTVFPYRAIVRLSYWSNGTSKFATGVLIAPDLVLTAGHAIYDQNNGAYSTYMTAYPGRSGNNNPYGDADAAGMKTYPGWTSVTGSTYFGNNLAKDLGLIRLSYPIGVDTGWLSVKTGLTTSTPVYLTGYHHDLGSGHLMYKTSGTVSAIASNGVVTHPLDMTGGASGSPIYNTSNQVLAVNIAESESLSQNYAVLIDSAKLSWIQAELNKDTVFRLLNPNTNDHIYTKDIYEVKALVNAGWIHEGVGWYASKSGSPVYRLFHSGLDRHFYTTSLYERDILISNGWTYENVAMYSASNQSVPVYRLFHNGTSAHVFTKDVNEKNTLVSQGWILEGIAWYAVE